MKRASSGQSAERLLKIVSRFVGSLKAEELDALLAGTSRLQLVDARDAPSAVGALRRLSADEKDELIQRIVKTQSVQAALEEIRAENLSKYSLETFARSLDLLVTKQDGVERLEAKIVEALVGSRLNSLAIRGT